MSACSSAEGSSVALRKHSSVRKRPTPWTGSALAWTALGAVGHVGEQLDRDAVGRRRRARTSRPAPRGPPCWRPRAPGPRRGPRPSSTSPDSPSTTRKVPCSTSVMPAVPTTQGMPSWRAMIAVWLVAPPRSVTRAVISSGSRPEVSLGREVLGDEHRRLGRRGHAGLGLADEVGDDPPLDVLEVGDPLGHQAAHVGEDRDELLDRRVHGGHQALAGGDVLGHRAPQPLVAGQARAGGQHLRGRRRWPGRPCARSCRRPR